MSVTDAPESPSGLPTNNTDIESDTQSLNPKKKKRGIIYLSTIPPFMNVTILRQIFGQYGEVERVYLQQNKRLGKRKRIPNQFTEGWIEFKRKKVAKRVAEMLNNQKIDNRKSSRYYDMIWNIKYIPRFKWTHLSERLTYEQAANKQRLRAEVAQAKVEATYLQENVEKSKRMKKNAHRNTK